MASYRPPISRDQYHDLEAYYFKLVMLTDTYEYREMKTIHRDKIAREISYINLVLEILGITFLGAKGNNERSIVAWKEKLDKHETYRRIFVFSSGIVASKALGISASKITGVCKEHRKTASGYIFKYEEDYHEDEGHLEFDASGTRFEFKNYLKDKNNE